MTKNLMLPSSSSVLTLVKAFGRAPTGISVSDAYEKDFCALPLPKKDVCWRSGTVELHCCTAPKCMRLKSPRSRYLMAKADNTTACSSRNPHALFLLASLLPLLPFGSLATCQGLMGRVTPALLTMREKKTC